MRFPHKTSEQQAELGYANSTIRPEHVPPASEEELEHTALLRRVGSSTNNNSNCYFRIYLQRATACCSFSAPITHIIKTQLPPADELNSRPTDVHPLAHLRLLIPYFV